MHVFILYFAFFYSFFLFIPPLVLAIVLFHVSLSASVSFSSTHYSSHSSSLSFFHFSSHSSSRSSSHSPYLPYLSNSFSPLSYRTSSLSWFFPSLVLVLIILSLLSYHSSTCSVRLVLLRESHPSAVSLSSFR